MEIQFNLVYCHCLNTLGKDGKPLEVLVGTGSGLNKFKVNDYLDTCLWKILEHNSSSVGSWAYHFR